MTTTIDFYFDFASPYAFFARHALEALAARHGAAIAYIPIDLKLAKAAAGNTAPPTVMIPRKLAFAEKDFRRWAAIYGIPFGGIASPKARDLNVGALLAIQRGVARAYVFEGFKAGWGHGGALDDAGLRRRVCEAAGLDWAEMQDFVASDAAETAYAAGMEAAFAKGVFGVPTMMVGDELWWGNDRLFMLDDYLAGQVAPARAVNG